MQVLDAAAARWCKSPRSSTTSDSCCSGSSCGQKPEPCRRTHLASSWSSACNNKTLLRYVQVVLGLEALLGRRQIQTLRRNRLCPKYCIHLQAALTAVKPQISLIRISQYSVSILMLSPCYFYRCWIRKCQLLTPSYKYRRTQWKEYQEHKI